MNGADESNEAGLMHLARGNDDFRRVVTTGQHLQVVVMAIQPGEEIGEETHDGIDQMLLFVDGEGTAVVEGRSAPVQAGQMAFVPAGTRHNFVNTGDRPLRLITTYAPPEHPPGTVHATAADAAQADHH
jgi:mannose-6-phosphate isomerase-like protein (cupin superfamily)